MGLHGALLWVYVTVLATYLTIAAVGTALFVRASSTAEVSSRSSADFPIDRAGAIASAAGGSAQLEVVETDERAVRVTIPARLGTQRRFTLSDRSQHAPTIITVHVPRLGEHTGSVPVAGITGPGVALIHRRSRWLCLLRAIIGNPVE